MSVTGFTPLVADTPSTAHTSSGQTDPAVPVLKTPCLAAGSCASNQFEHTSTAELVHRLTTGTPPSAEAGAEATPAASSSGSPVKSDESLKGVQVPLRRGGTLGGAAAATAGTRLSDAEKVEELHTASASGTGFSVRPVDSSLELLIVSALSQGSAQGLQSSTADTTNSGGSDILTDRPLAASHVMAQPVPGEATDFLDTEETTTLTS